MKYEYWLANISGIGTARIQCLLQSVESAKELYMLPSRQLASLPGLRKGDVERIENSKKSWNLEERFMHLQELGVGFTFLGSKDYPKKLEKIHNPPYALYYKGRLPKEEEKTVAIVGARVRSAYGQQAAGKLASLLAAQGVSVVSGLARGIDSDGHKGCLQEGGVTYAVIGCGIDYCYPAENLYLYQEIQKKGAVISEYPPGVKVSAGRFPARNRIIAGLSDCVIVVEAKRKSGSLITADFALEQGRDVFAVPGRITDTLSGGCNQLIRQGAGIIDDFHEFIKYFRIIQTNSCIQMNFSQNLLEKDEALVYSLLDFCPKTIGLLMEQTNFSLGHLLEVLGHLQSMELVKETIPNAYVRTI